MSPSSVIMRLVKDGPGPLVELPTVLPAPRSGFGIDTFRAPLLLVVLEPLEAATACSGLTGSSPLYSSTRTSGYTAAALKRTVTMLLLAAAGARFGAK